MRRHRAYLGVVFWLQIPSCWLTADHQAVVWCWQLVMATMRALFDCVDPATLQLTTNRTQIVDVFDYHLSRVCLCRLTVFFHFLLADYSFSLFRCVFDLRILLIDL